MIRLTLAQLRGSVSRLAPAGLAVALGTAFVTITLLAGNVMTRSTYDEVTAAYARADLLVTSTGDKRLTAADLQTVRRTAGVRAADAVLNTTVRLSHGTSATWMPVRATATDPALSPLRAGTGRLPRAAGEIALTPDAARRLHATVGDQVTVSWQQAPSQATTADGQDLPAATVTVVGLVDDTPSTFVASGGTGAAVPADVTTWSGDDRAAPSVLLVATGDPAATGAALAAALGGHRQVQTRDQAAATAVAAMSNDANQLVAVVLGFAAIALLVAGLVIANTFQVLVAQRSRTLALLRCVGARRAQLRASVLTEGALLGLGASVLGVVGGIGLTQLGLWVLHQVRAGATVPTTVPMSVWVVPVPLLVGTAVTVAACLLPARVAGRTSPVAALRPADAPDVRARAGLLRLVAALATTLAGAAALARATAAAGGSHDLDRWLAVGLLGAALSFVGVLLGAVLWVPRLVAGTGAALRRLGPATRLAAANAGRNPRRTAATASALLIGVTLVVTMSTGAATARRSLDAELGRHFPVDLQVEALMGDGSGAPAVSAAARAAVAATTGIAHVAQVRSARVTLGDGSTLTAYGIDAQDARTVLRDEAAATAIGRGEAVVPDRVRPGTLALRTGQGSTRTTAVHGWQDRSSMLLPAQVLAELAPQAPVTGLWTALATDANAGTVLRDVQDAVPDEPLSVSSRAAQRAQYEQLIDTLLTIVVALLAVAVTIAVIGVANTLSLSVLERRRECATLRAVGMTRRQLRGSLAAEGMLVAAVGTVLGMLLGVVYGWAGSQLVFGSVHGARLAVPWTDLVLVLAGALLAGLVASVLPARSAARTPPVVALAVQ